MKVKEKLAEEWFGINRVLLADQGIFVNASNAWVELSAAAAYRAGFENAREMAVELHRSHIISHIGSIDAEVFQDACLILGEEEWNEDQTKTI